MNQKTDMSLAGGSGSFLCMTVSYKEKCGTFSTPLVLEMLSWWGLEEHTTQRSGPSSKTDESNYLSKRTIVVRVD